jgi:hypothetical protein
VSRDRQILRPVAEGVLIVFDRSSTHPVEYTITLRVIRDAAWQTIYCFDNAHGFNEHHEHSYRGDLKQPPIVTEGDSNTAMGAALDKLLKSWPEIVDAWERTR